MLKPVLRFYAQSFYLIIGFFLLLGLVHFFLFEPSIVDGVSMQETFHDGDIILIKKLPLLFRKIERGDIVSINKGVAGALVVKRVMGLPGEHIEIKNGGIYITNAKGETFTVDEPYLAPGLTTLPAEKYAADYGVIPDFSYFVIGDNRPHSKDSRNYGFVSRDEIVGLVQPFLR